MSIQITGLDKALGQLRDIQRKAEALGGEHSVPVKELLTPSFLAQCSTFSSVDEMFKKSGFKIESSEDFAAIPDEPWNTFIRENTSYTSWKEMGQAAGAIWAKKQLGL